MSIKWGLLLSIYLARITTADEKESFLSRPIFIQIQVLSWLMTMVTTNPKTFALRLYKCQLFEFITWWEMHLLLCCHHGKLPQSQIKFIFITYIFRKSNGIKKLSEIGLMMGSEMLLDIRLLLLFVAIFWEKEKILMVLYLKKIKPGNLIFLMFCPALPPKN